MVPFSGARHAPPTLSRVENSSDAIIVCLGETVTFKFDQALADKGEIILYQTADGRTSIDVKLDNETVWLSRETELLFNGI